MYLKRITLQGFKSFARKTVLDFGPGITVICGPNGSGKSNISDAIKWVLGEQSMKNLRSKKSEDVIFVGSGKKAKAGMAEVSLELDNSKKIVSIEYTDVNIVRRVFRSSEGEYFLNGSKVRLLDIVEILSKSGFGRSTYTVIGQGMVDQLIIQTPEQRRELFEDASGVKHYYLKKEQALKKFEEARENLLRVSDIIREIKPRLNSLERQRKDAEERRILTLELRDLQKKYFGSELKNLKEKLDEYDKKYQEISKEIEKVEVEVSEINKKLEGRTSRAEKISETEKEQKLLHLEQEVQRLQDQLLELIRKDAQQIEKQNFYKENLESFKGELEKTQKEIRQKEEEIEKDKKEKEKLDEELKKLSRIMDSFEYSKEKSPEPQEVLIKVKKSLKDILDKIKGAFNKGKIEKELRGLISFLSEHEKEGFKDLNSRKQEVQTKIEKIKFEISGYNQKVEGLEEILKIYQYKERELQGKIQEGQGVYGLGENSHEKDTIEKKIKKLKEEKENQRKELEELRQKNRSLEGEFFEVEKSYREKRDILSEYKDELTKIEIEMARLKIRKEDIENEAKENLKLEEPEYISIPENQKEEVLQKIFQNKRKLETIGGAVSVEDEEEYKEVEERYDFLQNQSEDLKKALSSTKKVVLELEKKIHDQFREKFNEISEKFNFYFQKLFSGGMAKLILKEIEEEEKEPEMIIDIQAIPPGKRVHTLHTLSGGEKSLTSIALLFAIFSVNPTPFCVLDEVDAALDESNSVRFAQLLEELSQKTQFIVVTHNRETMKQAKVLYGVTMDEAKVSKVLSLKLEEAEKYSGDDRKPASTRGASLTRGGQVTVNR